MRILIVGATGTIGKAVAAALAAANHELVEASHRSTPLTVDLAVPASIRAMYNAVRKVDAVVSAAGQAKFGTLGALADEDFAFSLGNKLMAQVNLVRYGLDHVRDGGVFVPTSVVLARTPMAVSTAIGIANADLEGFARAAAL